MSSSPSNAAPAASAGATKPVRGLHDMTRGSVRGHVVRMMSFVLVGMAAQTLYGLVDMYWVGHLGQEAVAAVALSSNLMFVSLALTQMLSVGCVALVSQAAGRGEHAEVQRLFNQAQSLALTAGALFLAVGLCLRQTYAQELAGDATTAALSAEFLLGFIPALALQFTMVALGSALRGIGDMKPGLVAQTGSVLLNLVLAPFLIFGWWGGRALGVTGAALASLLATLIAVAGLGVYVARGRTFLRVRFAELVPDFGTWRKMLGIGLPAGAEFLLLATTIGVTYAVARPFGAAAQAGFGIGSRLMQVGFMPAVAISFSVAAVVGQNFGCRSFERVREATRESAKLVLAFMLFFTLICQLTPAPMVARFSSSPAVIAAGVDYLRTVSWGYFASGLVFVFAGVFQGLGNTWPSLLASALRATAYVAPALIISTRPSFALHSVWLISLGSVLLQLLLQQAFLRRELRAKAPLAT